MNGRISVVTFLVSFGCNIWALTNDLRNAFQLAKENEHHQIADMLDDVYNEQSAKNQSEVLRKRKTAIKEAEARNKKIEKQWKKTLKKERKENKKYSIPNGDGTDPKHPPSRKGSSSGAPPGRKTSGYPTVLVGTQGRSSQSVRDRDPNISYGPASELYDNHTGQAPPTADQQRSGEFKSNTFKNTAMSLMQFAKSTTDDDEVLDGYLSTFGKNPSEGLKNGLPKISTGLATEFVDEVGDEVSSPLELFLAVNDLSDYLMFFVDEDVDLTSLMMLTEQEITEQLSLPLGPRKKLLQAMRNREMALAKEKPMMDSSV